MAGKTSLRYLLFMTIVVVFIMAGLIAGSVVISNLLEGDDWQSLWAQVSTADLEEFILSSGPWGVGVAVGLMVLHSFIPFPAEFVAVANGMVYGPVWGVVITWTGAMLGAFLSFGLTRIFGRPFVNKILAKSEWQRVDDWVADRGGGALLLSRFIPVISFNLINYAAGLTRMSWWTFAWATGIGILPLTALMVIMGDRIDMLPWYAWLLLLVGGLILWLASHWFFARRAVSGEQP